MTPEELDKVKWNEAKARARAANPGGSIIALRKDAAGIYRQLTIDNWTPPDPISPRVRAAREWLDNGSRFRSGGEAGGADHDGAPANGANFRRHDHHLPPIHRRGGMSDYDRTFWIYCIGFGLIGFVGGIYLQRTDDKSAVGPVAAIAVVWPVILVFMPLAVGWWVGKIINRKMKPPKEQPHEGQ